jgi:hypothetical protein
MEVMLGLSLCSYLYLKLAKILIISYVFSSTNLRSRWNRFCLEERGMEGSGAQGEEGRDAQTMYTCMNK